MVTLRKLFALPEVNRIRLVSGEKGFDRAVTGVNVTESYDLADFFRQNELIVTTGINMAHDPGKWLKLTQTAYRHQAAGIVYNVGPYITEISQNVLDFGQNYDFPIFVMPWAERVADFVRLSVQFLTSEQQAEREANQLLAGLLFGQTTQSMYLDDKLARRVKAGSDQAIVVFSFESGAARASFSYTVEERISEKYGMIATLTQPDRIICWVYRTGGRKPHCSFTELCVSMRKQSAQILFGMGNFYKKGSELSKSYREALDVIRLNDKNPNLNIYRYQDMGAYALILDTADRYPFAEFNQKILGPLNRYDQLHQTELSDLLRIYLEEDGKTAAIAERTFIHRNTVLYRLKKIEDILGVALDRSFTKTNLTLAYMIEDILN
ncbi:PucR family transcriptional regulator [Sporolactobacillus nakayamae]|uniref:PucR C-terminal helix-turn-helix domain-containing protein n=1 Tax=Sporolactobacillus nakayamae TaxID=269670 RepID=A0A1I2T049_9BACL|nr:PucR family transcriptional regulator ligand-binding domain-containing protein [Sporolactobacillus nakayamae]SFG55806.1 PucR C-terminal helix-turn-helix domain-containing protein [Sporolactobacillus nakayamae]